MSSQYRALESGTLSSDDLVLYDGEDDGDGHRIKLSEKQTKDVGFWTQCSKLVSIIFVSFTMGGFCFWLVNRWAENQLRNNIVRQVNTYSPIFDEVDLPLLKIQINGSDEDINHTIYRQPPSPEVDEAWMWLSNSQTIWISSSDIRKMGKDPSTVAQLPEGEFGLGHDAYAAEMDIYHKIHCLNTLRKEIFFDYYYGDIFPDGKPSEAHKEHTMHCLYLLLQDLLCQANTDIFTMQWVEGLKNPFPDFSINRKCGDFDAVWKWQEGRLVDKEKYKAWRMPEDHVPVSPSDEFRRVFLSKLSS